MSEKEKRRSGFHNAAEFASMFICPLCRMPMSGGAGSAAVLRCGRGHSFDIARQGYVNLLTRQVKSKYGKRLFQARSLLCRSGLFAPLTELVGKWLACHSWPEERRPAILDAGCGEGSLLSAIRRLAGGTAGAETIWVGADIAKDGVMLAARSDPEPLWCVADLARCPLADGRFDAVLNLLSPSNYSEFDRLLAAGGLLVKAIPGSGHLRELRKLLYGSESANSPSEKGTAERRFAGKFELLAKERLTYRFAAGPELAESLIAMTPLSWGAEAAGIIPAGEGLEATVDLTLLLGRKRGSHPV